VDINSLKVFKTVVETGSISRASQVLNFAQSNVTTKIQQLENELGTSLFIRHNRGISLTAKGKTMLVYAEKILQLMEESQKAMKDDGDPSGSLIIGSMETTAAVRLPAILSKYHHQYPKVELTLITGPTEQHIQGVLQYKLDGAFVAGPIDHPELLEEVVVEEELVLITDTFHKPLRTITDIGARTLLVFRTGCSYRSKLEQLFQQQGIFPEKVMEFGTLEAIIGCVSAGLGVSLLPRSIVEKQVENGTIHVHTVPAAYSKVETVFIHRKDALITSAFQQFINMNRLISEIS
jgi:DNA-binding transcriptional LysR family regulator